MTQYLLPRFQQRKQRLIFIMPQQLYAFIKNVVIIKKILLRLFSNFHPRPLNFTKTISQFVFDGLRYNRWWKPIQFINNMRDVFIKFIQVQFSQKIADLNICKLSQVHYSFLPDFFLNLAQYFIRNISRFLSLNLVENFIEMVCSFICEVCRLGRGVLIVRFVTLDDNVFEVPAFYASQSFWRLYF